METYVLALTPEMRANIGNVRIRRGRNKKGRSLIQWDAAPLCLHDACVIYDLCPYEAIKDPDRKGNKCQVLTQFVRSFITMLYAEHSADLSETQLYQVGVHLVPLYNSLARMYIIELSVKAVVVTNDRGTKSMHPIFREIREQVKTIMAVWKSLGIEGLPSGIPNPFGGEGERPPLNPNIGAKTYYDGRRGRR